MKQFPRFSSRTTSRACQTYSFPGFPCGSWSRVKIRAKREFELVDLLREGTGKRALIAVGAPLIGVPQLVSLEPSGEMMRDVCLLEDRCNEGEFWLVQLDANLNQMNGWLIGPAIDVPPPQTSPIESERLKAAFTAAAEARWEALGESSVRF